MCGIHQPLFNNSLQFIVGRNKNYVQKCRKKIRQKKCWPRFCSSVSEVKGQVSGCLWPKKKTKELN